MIIQACKLYGTEEDVKFMFVGLIQRCEQIAMPVVTLSQAMDVFDERYYGLPNLIDALSAIILEMPNVDEFDFVNFYCFVFCLKIGEEFLGPLERLTVMSIDYYPRYQPKHQTTTYLSVIKMILALQTKPNIYRSFLSRIGLLTNLFSIKSFRSLSSHPSTHSLLFTSIKIYC